MVSYTLQRTRENAILLLGECISQVIEMTDSL